MTLMAVCATTVVSDPEESDTKRLLKASRYFYIFLKGGQFTLRASAKTRDRLPGISIRIALASPLEQYEYAALSDPISFKSIYFHCN